MPKLDADAANRVEEAESSDSVMAEGIYEAILKSVEEKQGPNGPYWNWTFVIPEDAPKYAKWNQWVTTSLGESSAWKMKEVFAAFGVTPDTDTDDLIGHSVRIEVKQVTIQKGARAGEPGNSVKRVLPLDPSDVDDKATGGGLF